MLDIEIFDVDYGFCSLINTADHHGILIDFGYSDRKKFNPSQHLLEQHCTSLDCLIIPSYGEEHLAGLEDLLRQTLVNGLAIHFIVSNPSLDEHRFDALRVANQKFSNGLINTDSYQDVRNNQTIKIHGINFSFFWNQSSSCQNVHDLSLVTFMSYRDIHVIFPGDLEVGGWQLLLKDNQFRDCLRRVNIFVAPNHGREESYCSDIFDYCRPELIIISNELNQRVSPKMFSQYQKHAKGSPYQVCDRKILTTYDDGNITISKCLDSLRHVRTQYETFQKQR
ncbi:MAG: hypothetical protein WBA43_03245 [Elainellaceae cyanobacterium]